MDLKPASPAIAGPDSGPDSDPKPTLSLTDDQAADFIASNSPKIGDVINTQISLKVTGMRDDQFGKSLNFDVQSIGDGDDGTDPTDSTDAADKAADESPAAPGGALDDDAASAAEEKTLGYKRPVSKKQSPPISAKDLMG